MPSEKIKPKLNVLAGLRVMRGLTQSDLAKVIGKSQCWYWMIESGMVNPSESDAKKIAEALGVNVDSLFPLSEEAAVDLMLVR